MKKGCFRKLTYEMFKQDYNHGRNGFYNSFYAAVSLNAYIAAKEIDENKLVCSENCPFCNTKYFEPMISDENNGGWCTLTNSYIIRETKCPLVETELKYLERLCKELEDDKNDCTNNL